MQTIRVWDLPIRLFHWLLVLAIIGLFVTANLGGNWMEWHQRLGYFVLGLVLFRLVWGFAGSFHARFANFLRGPKVVFAYMKALFRKEAQGETSSQLLYQPHHQPHYVGHNPMGAWSVIVILLAVGFQAISGLFADDEIASSGPYATLVSKEVSDFLTKLHKLNSDLLLVLIGIHIGAILFYVFVKKDQLIKPMFTGEKPITSEQFDGKIAESHRPYWIFWLTALVVAAFTYIVVTKKMISG